MGIGQTGRYVRTVRRFVHTGGFVRYGGRKYQDSRLLPHVNREVLVRELGYCIGVDIYECWYPTGTARQRWMPKNRPVWVMGTPIAMDVEPMGVTND